jgi:hypothetical protein
VGHVAKVKRATKYARAVAKADPRWASGVKLEGADVARMVPPTTANGLGRYRTIKRVVLRALELEREQTGPILVGRNDSRVEAARVATARRIAADAIRAE